MKVKLALIFAFIVAVSSIHAATVTVNIQNFAFVPTPLTINAGDTVTFVNQDSSTHTSTAGQPGTINGAWRSPQLSSGQSFSHTFPTAGTFPYYCEIHTFMTASITVQAAQSTPPTVTLLSPTNNTALAAPGNVTFLATAAATGGTVSRVDFLDGTNILATVTASPYTVTTNLLAGSHVISARVTDSHGSSTTSGIATVTVGSGGVKITDPIPAKIAKGDVTIDLKSVADTFVSPLGLATPDDGSGRLFVYDQPGLIYVISNDTKIASPMLDVRSRIVPLTASYDERGLLGVATHPNFAQKPLIYTYTSEPNGAMADFMIMGTPNDHQSVIAEWRVSATNANVIDPTSRREILRIDKPESNHNGGTLRFGPDGFLYFTVGDGGNADDQGDGHSVGGNGQDRSKILGKVSRIDVDARTSVNGQYGVPTDNPFVGQSGILPEIYAYGFRNPYSYSFDKSTGELYLGDVGQNSVEEVDKVTKGGNFGWSVREGAFYFDANGSGDGFVTTLPARDVPPGLIDPIAQYDHDEGSAVIGGYVYRGSAVASLSGKYVFGDWGSFNAPSGRLFYLDGTVLKELRIGSPERTFGMWLKGFGQSASGDVYIFGSSSAGPSGTSGKMLKVIAIAGANLMITGTTHSSSTLTINWTGGTAPYAVQRKGSLSDTNWVNVLTTSNQTAQVSIDSQAAFYRIGGQATGQ